MVTRSQSGIVKPIDRLSLITSSISPILKSSFLALKDPHWSSAMYDEYNALVKMVLGFLYPGHHWSKARLVANGSSLVLTLMRHSVQLLSQPSFERFLVLSYPVSGSFTNLMLRMNFLTRSLYGLKQAPRAWFQRFAGYATQARFSHIRCDSSLFIYT
ncbi:ribonuclease H-like domain-containing protein [Tanacetum coccineum]